MTRRYEYRFVNFLEQPKGERLALLNQNGAQGWQLVSVDHGTAVLMREIAVPLISNVVVEGSGLPSQGAPQGDTSGPDPLTEEAQS